jgi:hypothetical protein
MALQDYIAAALETLHKKSIVDYRREAATIMEQILDPDFTPPKPKVKRNLTKVASYHFFMKHYYGQVYQTVYNTLSSSETSLSRAEIANRSNLRLSTVCARVAELMEAGAIRVVGTKIDSDTNRKVEILEVNFETK